jgi:hypothetical protein
MQVKSLSSIPSKNSTDADWINWYKILQSEVGKNNANTLFLRAWDQRKNAGLLGSDANTSTLRDFLASKGVEVKPDGIFAYPISFIDSIEGGIESFFGVSKWVFIIIGAMILIPVAFLLFNIARNPKIIVDGLKAYGGAV